MIGVPGSTVCIISEHSTQSPTISGSFAENDLQLKISYGSSPPCIIGEHSAQSHIINGYFAENDLQLKASYASSPPCIIGEHSAQSPIPVAQERSPQPT